MERDNDNDSALHAIVALCIMVAADLRLMDADGAIDLEQWPNAKALVDAVGRQ